MTDKTNQVEETQAANGPVISTITPISEQIGRHVMAAMEQPGAVGVLTTVVPGIGADRVVSICLTDEQMDGVRVILQGIQDEDEADSEDLERCIGFQCRIDPKTQ